MGSFEVLRRGFVLFVLVLGISRASAAHLDPAPLSDDVVQQIQKQLKLDVPVDPLPQALSQHLDELDSLLSQIV